MTASAIKLLRRYPLDLNKMKSSSSSVTKSNLFFALRIGTILTVSITIYVSYIFTTHSKGFFHIACISMGQQNMTEDTSENETSTFITTIPEELPHRTYLISRTRCKGKVFLLILVFSAPANFDKRTIIRKTWATDPSLKIRWRSVFPLGQAAGDNVLNKKLEAEGMMYGDLIRGSYNEHYQNLTFKTQMGLEWAAKYCADFQFLLKADDDVFINPYALIDHLRIPDTPKTNLYTGSCRFGSGVFRAGKNGVTWEEYNKTRYPPFCSGPAYVLSSDVVYKLVEMFDVKKPFKNEDVYIGMLVEKIGGVRVMVHRGFRYGQCKHIPGTFSLHRAPTIECVEKLFQEAISERKEYELAQLRSARMLSYNVTNTSQVNEHNQIS